MTSPAACRTTTRRGTVGVAMIAAMVILQLLVVGVVLSDARDHDATVQRLDSSRAFYAADAGISMAMMELATGADNDADGAIGTISHDGNPDNDPLFITGRVDTSTTPSGLRLTLTSDGYSGIARQRINATFLGGAGRRMIYSQWANQFPQSRTWTGTSWTPAAGTLDFGAKQYWAVIKRCPTRQEVIQVCSLQTATLRAAVQTGATWGNLITATGDCGTINSRPYSLAYEQSTGRALVAYRSGNAATIYYRIWDGSAWSAESSTPSPLSGRPTYLKLIPKRGSSEIVLLVCDNNNAIAAMVWDGSAFGNKVTLESADSSTSCECADAAYESGTGRCMVVWGKGGSNLPQYRVWSGSARLAPAPMANAGGVPLWPHLAPHPSGNSLIVGLLDTASKINVCSWDGSSWSAYTQVEANAPTTSSRCFDVAFEGGGTRGLVMYGSSGINTPRFRTFDGTAWGAQQSAGALPNPPLLVQLTPSRAGAEIMTLINVTGGQNRLQFLRWDGASFAAVQELESNVSGPAGAEVFMIPDDPPGTSPGCAFNGWAQVAPQ